MPYELATRGTDQRAGVSKAPRAARHARQVTSISNYEAFCFLSFACCTVPSQDSLYAGRSTNKLLVTFAAGHAELPLGLAR